MIGLANLILRNINRLTNEYNWKNRCFPLTPSDLEYFHKSVEQRAYFAAERDEKKLPKEDYWKAAKASVALEIAGKFNGETYVDSFTPSEAMLPLDKEDADLISFVLGFPGVRKNWNRSVEGKVMEYLKQEFSIILKKRAESLK